MKMLWQKRLAPARLQAGFTLILALVLLTTLTLLALGLHRTAVAQARVSVSLASHQQALALASAHIAGALAASAAGELELPAAGDIELPPLVENGHQATGRLEFRGIDNQCEMPGADSAERRHYRIVSTGLASRMARSELAQGFSVCRGICPGGCEDVPERMQLTYWSWRN